MKTTSAQVGEAHAVAVIGGATAGAVVAANLAERGVVAVVFEQNARPWGKIEDGLPRWHQALRQKEYKTINERLSTPGVHFVPKTRIGSDVDFRALTDEWGFTAVVLANGAWRDRPLPVPDAEKWEDRGFVYQNSFIYWFNHMEEADYQGRRYETPDGAMVIGGGLASIDVAKIFSLETTRQALAERGIDVSMHELEHGGMPKTLAAHGLKWEDLGLEGCTIYYRRRITDMPLVSAPVGASPEQIAKVENSRRKIADRAMEKFCFKIEPLSGPKELMIEGGGSQGDSARVVGMRFSKNRVVDGKAVATGDTFERRAPLIVSSIGSVPAPIRGLPMKGELLAFDDWNLGTFDEFPTVFGVGNVVTGKGNIVASRKHSNMVSEHIIESFLGLDDNGHQAEGGISASAEAAATERAHQIADHVETRPRLSGDELETLIQKVRAQQKAVGYGADFRAWMVKMTPPDLA